MIPLLFEKDATDFSTRGLYALSDAISCTVTEERNGLFELELVYPTDGNHFSEITEDRLIVAFPHENGTKQAFRIYRREASIEGTVTFYARHISYQLNFIPVDLVSGETDSAQTMMETLAQAAQVACPFSFESDVSTAVPVPFSVGVPCGLRSALGGMEGSVLDHFGGEFEWDNWTVRLLENRGSDNGVRIAYGKNLTEYDDALDIGETITGVMAYYAYQDENDQEQIVYTNPKVITNGSTEFAHERIAPLDCSGDFDEPPTVEALTAYATQYLARTANADPTQEINVSFVPLGQTAEYTGLAELERVSLCDTVKVSYPALGISVKKKVTRTVWNVLTNSYDEITLGTEQTLVDTIVDLQSGGGSGGSSGGGSGGSVDLLTVYPIGSIYMSTANVNPRLLFGGQWEQLKDTFLLAAGDTYAGGATGGEATHTLTTNEMPSHNHGEKSLTGYFNLRRYGTSGAGTDIPVEGTSGIVSRTSPTWSGSHGVINAASRSQSNSTIDRITTNATHTHSSNGGGAAHNNMPPYLAVYVWKRTA